MRSRRIYHICTGRRGMSGYQVFAAQFLLQARVAGQHHALQRLRIESCAGHQAQFRQHWRRHLLRFVNQQHGTAPSRFEMSP